MKAGDDRITIAMPLDDPCWEVSEAEVLEWPKTDIHDRRMKRCFVDYIRADLAAERERRLASALKGLLGPAVLGSQTRDELERDWGGLGMSHVDAARKALSAHESRSREGGEE